MKKITFLLSIICVNLFLFGQEKPEIIIPMQHNGAVHNVKYSPDEKYIVSSSIDQTIKVWKGKDGSFLKSIPIKMSELFSKSCFWWLKDSKTIAVAATVWEKNVYEGGMAELQFWDIEKGEKYNTISLGRVGMLASYYYDAVISNNRSKIITSIGDNKLNVWNTETGNHLFTLSSSNSTSNVHLICEWSSNDEKIAALNNKGSGISVFNGSNGAILFSIIEKKNITDVKFSPDDKYILIGTQKYYKIYDASNGKLIRKIKQELDVSYIKAIVWSPDSKKIASQTNNKGELIIRNANTGKVITKIINIDNNVITNIIWSKDSKRILSCSLGGKLTISDAKTGLNINSKKIKYKINYAHWSNDEKRILYSNGSYPEIIDSKTMNVLFRLGNITPEIIYTTLSPNNKFYFVTTSNSVRIINNRTGSVKKSINKKGSDPYIYWTDNKKAFMFISNNKLMIYDAKTFNLIDSIGDKENPVFRVSISPNNKFVTIINSSSLRVWDLEKRKIILKKESDYIGFKADVFHYHPWSPSGNKFISWGINGLYMTDIKSNTTKKIDIKADGVSFKYVSWLENENKIIITADINNERYLYYYNIETKELSSKKINRRNYPNISPNKLKIAYIDNEGLLHISSNNNDIIYNGNIKNITDIRWNISSTKMSITGDYNTQIWNVEENRIINIKADYKYHASLFSDYSDTIIECQTYNHLSILVNANNGNVISPTINLGEYMLKDVDFYNNYTLSTFGSTIKLNDLVTGKEIVSITQLNNTDFFTRTHENYYYASKNGVKALLFKYKQSYYNFDQFDIKYNRPDIVLQKLGNTDTTLIKAYHRAYLKRLKKMGFKEEDLNGDFHIPESKIKNFEYLPVITDSSDIDLNLHFEDSKYKLDRINIWINDVAVYGTNGINLREENASNIDKDVKLKLLQGENKIQVSCLNQKGAESYKETVNITYKPKQEIKPNLYLITIGTSKYKDERFNLQYAAKDAQDVASLFKEDKYFNKVITKTLTNEQVTKESIAKLKEFLKQATRNDQVIVFVAGHGVLDANLDYYLASNDIDFNYPEKRGIPYEELESILDGIQPLKKILFVDACHSGEIDKDEMELAKSESTSYGDITFRSAGAGVVSKTNNLGLQNTTELTKELFTDLRRGTGATVVSSAGGGEYAMESGEWKNGLFTYSLINGIRSKKADLNKDGKIMLSELQKYVQSQVVELSGGKQQPTSRIENISMDFRVW